MKTPEENKYKFFMDTIQLKYNESYLAGQDPKFKDVENQIIKIIKNKDEKSKHYESGMQYLELFIDDRENYLEKHINELNDSSNILEEVRKSKFKRVYFFSGKYLFIVGTNPEENMGKFNN